MAYKILTKDHIVAILMALAPRFVGRDQDHLLGLADEAAWAAYDRAYDSIEPLQEFQQLLQGPAGASVVGITDLGGYYSGTTIEEALEQVGAFIDGGPYIPESEKAIPNGVATLAADGRLEPGQLPQLAITDTFEASSEAEMLGLPAEKGDVAVRTDLNQSFILAAEPASSLSNWTLLRSPTDSVTSVFGRVGVVTAETGDYSWSQIADKPTSFPPSAHTHVWADITNPPVYTSRWPSFSEVTSKPTTLAGYGITDSIWTSSNFNPSTKVDTSRSVTAGVGLVGGGSLSSDVAISLGTPDSLSPTTTNSVSSTAHTHYISVRWDGADGTEAPAHYPQNLMVMSRIGSVSGTAWPEWGVAVTAHANARSGQLVFAGGNNDLWWRAGSTAWGTFKKAADDALVVHMSGSERVTGTKTFSHRMVLEDGAESPNNTTIVIGTGANATTMRYNGVFARGGNTMYFRPNGPESPSGEMSLSTAGNVTANDFYATSDARLKTVTASLTSNGYLIPRRFIWKATGKEDFGFLAQEVQKNYPELVETVYTEQGDESHLTVNYAKATAVLAAQVLELKDELNKLKETLQNGR